MRVYIDCEKQRNGSSVMATVGKHRNRWVITAFVCGATSALSVAQGVGITRFLAGGNEDVPTRAVTVTPSVRPTEDVIGKMIELNHLRNEELHRYSVVRTYEIRNSGGVLSAQAVIHVSYEGPEKKVFHKTSEKGSTIMVHQVFERLMEAESETSSSRKASITRENYSFAPAGEEDVGPYHCYVFDVTPKRKERYLFEGKIWVDAREFAIVKIAGHPVKEPSFWVNQTDFIRQYQKIERFWLPYRDETSVDVKLYGRKVFTVDYQQYAINSESSGPTEISERGATDQSPVAKQ